MPCYQYCDNQRRQGYELDSALNWGYRLLHRDPLQLHYCKRRLQGTMVVPTLLCPMELSLQSTTLVYVDYCGTCCHSAAWCTNSLLAGHHRPRFAY